MDYHNKSCNFNKCNKKPCGGYYNSCEFIPLPIRPFHYPRPQCKKPCSQPCSHCPPSSCSQCPRAPYAQSAPPVHIFPPPSMPPPVHIFPPPSMPPPVHIFPPPAMPAPVHVFPPPALPPHITVLPAPVFIMPAPAATTTTTTTPPSTITGKDYSSMINLEERTVRGTTFIFE